MQRNRIKISPISIEYPNLADKNRVFAGTSLAAESPSSHHQQIPKEYETYLDADSLIWLSQEKIPVERLALARQVHGKEVRYIDSPGVYPNIDGFYTDCPEIYLTIRTADCAAVFVAAPDVPVVGLAHAGWRGAQANIIGNLIDQMTRRWNIGPKWIQIAVSPHIRSCCYEVGTEFVNYFPPQFLREEGSRLRLDLEKVLLQQLKGRDIPSSNILTTAHCTSCSPLPLYSYRAQQKTTKRLFSVIALRE